jgi:hypothetical protein
LSEDCHKLAKKGGFGRKDGRGGKPKNPENQAFSGFRLLVAAKMQKV